MGAALTLAGLFFLGVAGLVALFVVEYRLARRSDIEWARQQAALGRCTHHANESRVAARPSSHDDRERHHSRATGR